MVEIGPGAGSGGGEVCFGSAGGRVVAVGTPERIAGHPSSHTGRFLAERLAAT